MDIRQQVITEYLNQGKGYRQLAAKYSVSRTTIKKWVMIHQGKHTIPLTENQQKYYLSAMYSTPEKSTTADHSASNNASNKFGFG